MDIQGRAFQLEKEFKGLREKPGSTEVVEDESEMQAKAR